MLDLLHRFLVCSLGFFIDFISGIHCVAVPWCQTTHSPGHGKAASGNKSGPNWAEPYCLVETWLIGKKALGKTFWISSKELRFIWGEKRNKNPMILFLLNIMHLTYLSGSGLSTLACSQMMGSTPSETSYLVTIQAHHMPITCWIQQDEDAANKQPCTNLRGRSAAAVWAVLEIALCAWRTWQLRSVWAGAWCWPVQDNCRGWWPGSA